MNNDNNHEENLNKIKKESFNVPDGYFEELPGKIMDKIDLLEGKKVGSNAFATPEGYFEQLPNLISDKISSRKSARPFFKRAVVLIPLTCILLVLGFLYLNNDTSPEKLQATSDELENSIYLQTIDESLLIDELIATQEAETSDSLTEYLINNNIDLTDLYNSDLNL